jgi:hypothetical protein
MNQAPKHVTLRLGDGRVPAEATLQPDLDPGEVERMLQHAERLGLSRHPDPSTAALLAAVRLRPDVPDALYIAFSAVLSRISAAADHSATSGTT